MPLKRTAALAVAGFVVLGGGATAFAATQRPGSPAGDPASTDTLVPQPTDPGVPGGAAAAVAGIGDITVDPDTGALTGPGFTLQPPTTAPDGSATFSGTGPDGRPHTATITPGVDGSWPTVTIDGRDLRTMIDEFLAQNPGLRMPDIAGRPGRPSITVPPEVRDYIDRAREALEGAVGGSLPAWPGQR